MRDDSIAYKLNIVSASLFVKKVSVSPGVRLGHAQALLSTTAKYPIDRFNSAHALIQIFHICLQAYLQTIM